MSASEIPDELVHFIRDNVFSVEQLEILMLLRRQPTRAWSVQEITSEMRSGQESVSSRLADLASRGLVTPAGSPTTYSYGPPVPRLQVLVDQLAEAYELRRFRVIDIIFSRPSDVLHGFAEAFRLRKGGKE